MDIKDLLWLGRQRGREKTARQQKRLNRNITGDLAPSPGQYQASGEAATGQRLIKTQASGLTELDGPSSARRREEPIAPVKTYSFKVLFQETNPSRLFLGGFTRKRKEISPFQEATFYVNSKKDGYIVNSTNEKITFIDLNGQVQNDFNIPDTDWQHMRGFGIAAPSAPPAVYVSLSELPASSTPLASRSKEALASTLGEPSAETIVHNPTTGFFGDDLLQSNGGNSNHLTFCPSVIGVFTNSTFANINNIPLRTGYWNNYAIGTLTSAERSNPASPSIRSFPVTIQHPGESFLSSNYNTAFFPTLTASSSAISATPRLSVSRVNGTPLLNYSVIANSEVKAYTYSPEGLQEHIGSYSESLSQNSSGSEARTTKDPNFDYWEGTVSNESHYSWSRVMQYPFPIHSSLTLPFEWEDALEFNQDFDFYNRNIYSTDININVQQDNGSSGSFEGVFNRKTTTYSVSFARKDFAFFTESKSQWKSHSTLEHLFGFFFPAFVIGGSSAPDGSSTLTRKHKHSFSSLEESNSFFANKQNILEHKSHPHIFPLFSSINADLSVGSYTFVVNRNLMMDRMAFGFLDSTGIQRDVVITLVNNVWTSITNTEKDIDTNFISLPSPEKLNVQERYQQDVIANDRLLRYFFTENPSPESELIGKKVVISRAFGELFDKYWFGEVSSVSISLQDTSSCLQLGKINFPCSQLPELHPKVWQLNSITVSIAEESIEKVQNPANSQFSYRIEEETIPSSALNSNSFNMVRTGDDTFTAYLSFYDKKYTSNSYGKDGKAAAIVWDVNTTGNSLSIQRRRKLLVGNVAALSPQSSSPSIIGIQYVPK
ncbi:hypothetical protein GS597_08975 [Synechococcales cyanobacterium C]|uniref:Uncharacterized protein n=1 Tax=Petrachloros mirabilis ULC683 TaxID=2781853 RepID=A0A8K2A774_9CYAN|nr:hypothetical protein [Petrachloros mirabilis]NCJ06634.1 hypothetical protein [Petrachloros mirabilis ULC683]